MTPTDFFCIKNVQATTTNATTNSVTLLKQHS